MQFYEILYTLLILCIPMLFINIQYLNQKKSIIIFFTIIISISFFLIPGIFSFLGFIFIIFFLLTNSRTSKIDHLLFSFIFFSIGSIEFFKNYSFNEYILIFLSVPFYTFIVFLVKKK